MALRKAKPLVWSPHGASDTLDASTSFPGAMSALTNLIPDPSTKDLWQCRPAALQLSAFPGFNTPTFVSVWRVVGTRVYGMVSSAANPGHDEPFAYDISTNAFIPITGVTNANTPVSPLQVGAWNPPSMDLVGAKVVVTHPGFTGAGGVMFGMIDISNPAAPTWTGTNTAPQALPAPPQWVANFFGRAYFLVNPPNGQPGAYLSDVLLPSTITNAGQVLTFGDNVPLTCAAGLPLSNQLGGIIQSLIVFKGVSNIYQVTGDFSNNTLAVNSLNVATGTLGPNTVIPTTRGLAFIAPDGLRVIDFDARVSDPVGHAGDGITAPFFFSVVPSRMVAAFNGGVYRAQVQNGNALGNPQQEWWYDVVRGVWSGPHTTNVSMIEPYANTFLITIQGAGAKIFQSDQVQGPTSTYVENNQQLTYNFQTSMLPDTDLMAEVCIIEATLYAQLVAQNNIVVTAMDQDGTVLDIVTITASGAATIWGAFQWGQALWQGAKNALAPRQLKWTQPLVFRRLTIAAVGYSAAGIKLGRLHLRYQVLGYLQSDQPAGIAKMPSVLAIGTFTLNANATQTVVIAPCIVGNKVFYAPTTQDAANDGATTSVVVGNGSFTMTHANNPRVDRTFDFEVVG